MSHILDNSSISSTLASLNDPSFRLAEEQEMEFYANIKMNLQAIQKATHSIDQKLKNIQKQMRISTVLIDAIQSETSTDTSSPEDM